MSVYLRKMVSASIRSFMVSSHLASHHTATSASSCTYPPASRSSYPPVPRPAWRTTRPSSPRLHATAARDLPSHTYQICRITRRTLSLGKPDPDEVTEDSLAAHASIPGA